ncbi:MAG: type II toxin-antitoxin system VapC family toxin [Phycisphaerales bacterium]|nr:type II toxin-antitoxin system VapC family toxin [Phycisphaerales bacterium]
MSYLMDTCTVCELGKPNPNRKVRDVLLELPREEIYLSTISLGEIQYGIDTHPNPNEKIRLEKWLNVSILAVFGNRMIDVNTVVALRWGRLIAELKSRGQKMQTQDSLIAATALEFGHTLITRNEKDFASSGVHVFNPW